MLAEATFQDWLDFVRRATPAQRKAAMELVQWASGKWRPLPGPQTMARNCLADELFYGGAAGGGKSALVLGVATTDHTRSLILRRVAQNLRALSDQLRVMLPRIRPGGNPPVWRHKVGGVIELGGCQYDVDKNDYSGREHDLKAFDEIQQFLESQYRFIITWLRSANPRQRKRIICTGNPPTTPEGYWVVDYWGPWLNPLHPKPAEPGELRYFTTIDGKDQEVDSPEPFRHNGRVIVPRSRTFIPAKVTDNPFMIVTGYESVLQGLPEPLRSKFLDGNFQAGLEDDEWQVIPTEWVLQAQARWRARANPEEPPPGVPMTSEGVDVARGGKDKTIISPRYRNWWARQIAYPGLATPDGEITADLVMLHWRPPAVICPDVIGVGAAVYDFLKRHPAKPRVNGINSAAESKATDKTGFMSFANKRAELWWTGREYLNPANGNDAMLPDDRELLIDLTAVRWKLTTSGVQMELKEDTKKRIGRSPDKGDSWVYSLDTNFGGYAGVFKRSV